MRFKTSLTALLCLISISFAHGQIFKNISLPSLIKQVITDLTFEVGINKSKVFNTKKISSFEGDRNDHTYTVNIEKEFYPITSNYNMSLGYRISKKHHIRLRYAKNKLGSVLIGSLSVVNPNFPSFPPIILDRLYSLLLSKSIGIIYEYQIPYYEGSFVFGAGFERQRSQGFETLKFPGIEYQSYSFHSHFGYLAELNEFIQLHGKVFSTYYISNNRQIYDAPVDSKYVPLQVGFEIGFRLNFENAFRHSELNKNQRRKRKMFFIKQY